MLVSSVEPEKLGSKASVQPAGTVSTDGEALAVVWLGDGVDVADLLGFGDGADFVGFLPPDDGTVFVGFRARMAAFVNAAACGDLDGENLYAASATRPTASTTTTPRTPTTVRGPRMERLAALEREPPERWLGGRTGPVGPESLGLRLSGPP